MIEKFHLNPPDMWSRYENDELMYAPIVVVRYSEHADIFLAGQVSRLSSGTVVGVGDMRKQIYQVCRNIQVGLAHVGAGFDDVVRCTTYVTDLDLYIQCSDERYKFFRSSRPTNTLVPVDKLGAANCMIEIECQAVIDSQRVTVDEKYRI